MSEILNQNFQCPDVAPEMMDRLWAAGWRHFGSLFFRYNFSMDEAGVRTITPLRIDLEAFHPSKSQRRVLKKNADLHFEFVPAELSEEAREMFQRHKARFKDNVPDDLETFLSDTPATVPCPCVECRVFLDQSLVATSFLDVGKRATSAVYGLFEPEHAERSLGTLTMLKEIEYSREQGCRYYYPGYATQEPSAYDYKKQFHGMEVLDWADGTWRPFSRPVLM